MDISELKSQSDLSYDRAVAKKNQLARAESEQILIHQDHVFKANAETILLVRTLSESHDSFVMLDANSNPVMINSAKEFLQRLLSCNQAALNTYHQTYQQLKTLKG